MYPQNKDFIFTIFDDTDVSTLENIKPVYDFLYSVGMLTTKSVWPLSCNDTNSWYYGSDTLQDQNYAEYMKKLHKRGFEIGFHGATMESSIRCKTEHALNYFNDILGFYPKIYACHANNKENIYWGAKRFVSRIISNLYHIMSKDKNEYLGSNNSSVFFWGDLAKKHIHYTRSFTFFHINLLNITKYICYQSKHFPYINNWFISSDADNVEEFNRLISIKNQEKLENEKGVCIISTHFGKGFVRNGKIHPITEELLRQLAKRNGLFMPVSTILTFLKAKSELCKEIPDLELFKIESLWLFRTIFKRFYQQRYLMSEKEYLKTH